MRTTNKKIHSDNLIATFGFKSIFSQILLLLLIYSALILAAFSAYILYVERSNINERLQLNSVYMLEKTQENVDNQLSTVRNQLQKLSKDEYICSAMTAPDLTNTERNYNIIYQLQNAKNTLDLAADAYLYIPTDKSIYCSNGFIGYTEDIIPDDHITCILASAKEMCSEPIGTAKLHSENGELFLFYNAPDVLDYTLGVLAFRLDMGALFTLVEGRKTVRYGNFILLYDENGVPLFNSRMPYPDSLHMERLTSQYYSVVSGKTGWQFLFAKSSKQKNSIREYMNNTFILILLLLSLICIGFSVAITRRFYVPIQKLAGRELPETTVKTESTKNELELIEKKFDYVLWKNRKMESFFAIISPKLTEDIFRSILQGHEVDDAKINAAFEQLQCGFTTSQKYRLILASFSEENLTGDVRQEMEYQHLMQAVSDACTGCCSCSFVRTLSNPALVSVLGFPNLLSEEDIAEHVQLLNSEISKAASALSVSVISVSLSQSVPLSELYQSFVSIRRDFFYVRYSDTADRTAVPQEDLLLEKHLEELLKQTIALLGSGEKTPAEIKSALHDALCSELESADTADKRKHFVRIWSNVMVKTVLQQNLEEKERLYSVYDELIPLVSDETLLLGKIYSTNNTLIDLLYDGIWKHKKQYVERAKQYIRENYWDVTLSLSAVSDYLDISQGYFTAQFKKATGSTFLDYVNRYRIEQSIQLLVKTQLSIEEIGYSCGFTSSKSFIRVFKKYEEMSPGAYRREKIESIRPTVPKLPTSEKTADSNQM